MIATVTDDQQNKSGVKFESEEGRTLFVARNVIQTNPPELLRDAIRDNEVHLYQRAKWNDVIYAKGA